MPLNPACEPVIDRQELPIVLLLFYSHPHEGETAAWIGQIGDIMALVAATTTTDRRTR